MRYSIINRALLRGLLAGGVILAGTTACSRSDRTESDQDGTAVLPDTTSDYTADTASSSTGTGTETGAATSDPAAKPNTPRAETGAPDDAAGYRAMERDTAATPAEPSDTARATNDSASGSPSPDPADTTISQTPSNPDIGSREMAGATAADSAADVSVGVAATDSSSAEIAGATAGTEDEEPVPAEADTAVAGYSDMARDTSSTAEQADTAWQVNEDVAIQARVDTTDADAEAGAEAEVAVEGEADPLVVMGDSANVAKTGERMDPVAATPETNDTLTDVAEAEPVRPTEDSTETVAAAEVRTEAELDAEADAPTDEVGAAAIGGNVTGADAWAGMTRQGAACIVVDPESAQGVALDMSETPASLNPCGLGSMVLTRIWTKKE